MYWNVKPYSPDSDFTSLLYACQHILPFHSQKVSGSLSLPPLSPSIPHHPIPPETEPDHPTSPPPPPGKKKILMS